MTALATSAFEATTAPRRRIRRRTTPWLGVDVGTHSVKLAVVGQNAAGHWELLRAKQVAWPYHADPFGSPELLSAALREVLTGSRADWEYPKLRNVAFSLPGCALSRQEVAADSHDATAVERSARAAMQQLYGERSEQLAFDAWLPDAVPNSFADAPSTGLVWADAEVVSQSLAAFRHCRLAADVLDAEPLTTARASELFRTAFSDTQANSELVVDWGATGISLTWLFDGQPRFRRTSIQGGFAEAIQSVAERFSLAVSDAEFMLARYGLPGAGSSIAGNDGLSQSIESCLTEPLQILLDEFDRTLGFLGSRYPRQPVQRCLLTGGGAAIRRLDAWLSQQTDIPARSWNLPTGRDCLADSSLLPAPVFAHAAALSALAWEL